MCSSDLLVGPASCAQAMLRTTSLHAMEGEDFAVIGIDFASGAVGSILASTASFPGAPALHVSAIAVRTAAASGIHSAGPLTSPESDMPLGSTRRPSIFAGIRARCRLVWFTWLALLGASTATAQQSFDIAMRDGLLSIRANGASVTELAAALAAETGINFVVTGNGGTPITADIVPHQLELGAAAMPAVSGSYRVRRWRPISSSPTRTAPSPTATWCPSATGLAGRTGRSRVRSTP